MAGNKPISGFPVAVTTVGASFAAVQGGINVQVPSTLFSGTVSTVSVVGANGFYGTVVNPTTMPAITLNTSIAGLLKGDGTQLLLATNADLPAMTATVGGAVPTPPNNTSTFLRGDGTFATPAGAGSVTHTGTLTSSALILGNGGVDITALGSLGTTTTVLHGNAAGNPSFGAVSLTADISGTLAETHGGTNQTTYTTGDILYASGANTLAKLGIGSTGQALTVSGGLPAWGSGGTGGETLLATLTTTSGTTQTATGLATIYNMFRIEIVGVKQSTTNENLLMDVSSDNGSTFNGPVSIAVTIASNALVYGLIWIGAVGLTSAKPVSGGTVITAAYTAAGGVYTVKTSPTNAVRFSFQAASAFSGGTIRIYGVK